VDIGSLIVLGKAVLEASKEPIGIGDLPKTPPYEVTPSEDLAGFDIECPIGTEKVFQNQQYICKPKGM